MESVLPFVVLCPEERMASSFASFREMKNMGELCDVKISVGDKSFLAHRVILSAKIPYIRQTFGAIIKGQIDLGNLQPTAVEVLLDYAYCAKVKITSENVSALLEASQFLRVKEVSNECVKLLIKLLKDYDDLKYAADLWQLAGKVSHPVLEKTCVRYVRENFEKLLKSDDFANLPFLLLEELISGDYLSISSEQIVFEAIVDWVKVAPPLRQQWFFDLLRQVRLIYLPKAYLLERVASEELVKSSSHCKELVDQAKNYHLSPRRRALYPNMLTSPRRCVKDGIYVICQSLVSASSLHHYDLYTEKWEEMIPEMQDDRVSGAVIVRDKLYTFLDNRIEMHNLRTLAYEQLELMHENSEGEAYGGREGVIGAAIVCHEDVIYFFGSDSQYSKYVNRVRCFDTRNKTWMEKGRMKMARIWSAATSLDNLIYVTGGSEGHIIHKTAEKYNPITGECTEIAPMLSEREGHGCTAMNGRIYVSGGATANRFLNSAEEYDPATNVWTFITSAMIPRRGLSLVSNCNNLYVLGGITEDNKDALDAEIYDGLNGRWRLGFRVKEKVRYIMLIPGAEPEWDFWEKQQQSEQKTFLVPSCSFQQPVLPKKQKLKEELRFSTF